MGCNQRYKAAKGESLKMSFKERKLKKELRKKETNLRNPNITLATLIDQIMQGLVEGQRMMSIQMGAVIS